MQKTADARNTRKQATQVVTTSLNHYSTCLLFTLNYI